MLPARDLRISPFNTIKIDGQFIAELAETGGSRAIVQAIIRLGHALGMSVTAEGVETSDQLALLQDDRCEEVQGFLLAKPLPEDELLRFMKRRAEREPV